MSGILDFWRGYRTKILAFLINLTALALAMDYIDGKTAVALTMFFGGTGLATLRAGVTNEVATVMHRVNQVDARVAAVAPVVAQVGAQLQEVKAVVEDMVPPTPSGAYVPHILKP